MAHLRLASGAGRGRRREETSKETTSILPKADGQNLTYEDGNDESTLLTLLSQENWGPLGQFVRCYECKSFIETDTIFVPSIKTYTVSVLLLLTGHFLLTFLLPYYFPEMLKVMHICPVPSCRAKLGESMDWLHKNRRRIDTEEAMKAEMV